LLDLYVVGIEVHLAALSLVARHTSGRHDRGNRLAEDRALYLDAQRQAIFRQPHCDAIDRHLSDGSRKLPVETRLEIGLGEGKLAGPERKK
jgi:hypothetical protein